MDTPDPPHPDHRLGSLGVGLACAVLLGVAVWLYLHDAVIPAFTAANVAVLAVMWRVTVVSRKNLLAASSTLAAVVGLANSERETIARLNEDRAQRGEDREEARASRVEDREEARASRIEDREEARAERVEQRENGDATTPPARESGGVESEQVGQKGNRAS